MGHSDIFHSFNHRLQTTGSSCSSSGAQGLPCVHDPSGLSRPPTAAAASHHLSQEAARLVYSLQNCIPCGEIAPNVASTWQGNVLLCRRLQAPCTVPAKEVPPIFNGSMKQFLSRLLSIKRCGACIYSAALQQLAPEHAGCSKCTMC